MLSWTYHSAGYLLCMIENKSLTQNIQEIWDTMKRQNLRIIGIKEGEEIQLKSTDNIQKIIEENFSNLKKDMPMKVQEPYTK